MQRKLIYIVLLMVILTGIILPAIYSNKVSKNNQVTEQSQSGTVNPTETVTVNDTAKNEEQKAESQPGQKTDPKAEEKAVGVMSVQATGETDNSSIAQNTAARNSEPSGTAGQDNAMSVQKPTGTDPASVKEVGCTVGVTVVGKEGELLYPPGNVTVTQKNIWDVTALGALDATGLSYTMSKGFSGFVEAVADCRNKGQSGWMYMVNGEMPKVASNQKSLKAGDKVIWWYSKSMDSPIPDWEELSKRKQ